MTVYKNRLYPNYWDMFAVVVVFSLIFLLAWGAKLMAVPYHLGLATPITLDPTYLPYYALRTVLRMIIAMVFSLLFTLTIATWAAKSRRAERFIIPLIDILQSVPILGFLSITVVAFIKLFPGSMLGPECAAIFVIFTSQAWNMALGFYQSVQTVPTDLQEVARMYHLSSWQRFWRIEVPYSLPGLLWNMMVSMSAGWFFVVASEAISISNQQILLPGIGSYIATAIAQANTLAIFYAITAMFIVILIYDQLAFRPLVNWANKFKAEKNLNERVTRPWVILVLQRTHLLRYLGQGLEDLWTRFVNLSWPRLGFAQAVRSGKLQKTQPWLSPLVIDLMFWTAFALIAMLSAFHVQKHISLAMLLQVFKLGLFTGLRVFILVILSSFIWVPIGVYIGLRPQLTSIVQPIAQFLAAFPANLLYPLAVIAIVNYHVNPEIGLTPLMILGAQWYILFNVIAGAASIPKDLIDVTDNLNVGLWLRWKRLILPGIFPYYVTGAITAAGGAWNASIVAEIVNWGNTTISIPGLGEYISRQTTQGNFTNIALAIGVMSLIVVLINRMFWRPLYVLATTRFALE
jgi:NitT/TauT family transport system permease protein